MAAFGAFLAARRGARRATQPVTGSSAKSTAVAKWEVVLSVLMAATPCPAIIGVPVALLSGMSVASPSNPLSETARLRLPFT